MKAGILFSGGKDSCAALNWALKEFDVKCIISITSQSRESYMFHIPNVWWTKVQAKAMEIPLLTGKTKGEKEKELEDLKKTLQKAKQKYGIEAVVAGALASSYQKERVENVCKELGLEAFAPYWKDDPEKYMRMLLKEGFEMIITGVAAEGLTMDFLGKNLDETMLEKLIGISKKTKMNINGEGGEYETFVTNGPMFKKRISITESEISMENANTGTCSIKKAQLLPRT